MKRTTHLILLTMALLAILFSACASPQSAQAPPQSSSAGEQAAADSGEQLTFALTMPTFDNPYFVNVRKGFEQFCEENGIKVVANSCEYDDAEQYSQFENYIQMGVDGIVCGPVNDASIAVATQLAQEAGIKVVGQAQIIQTADGNSVVDDYGYGINNGTMAANWINNVLGGEAKVCLITLDHVEQVKLRGDGMEDALKELCPDAQIVHRQKAETIEEAMAVAETVLQAHPDIKVFACVNDQHALGANEAVLNMGAGAEDLYIGGGDYTDEVIAKMREDNCYIRQSTDIGPADSGYACAKMLYDMIVNGAQGEDLFFTFTPMWQESAIYRGA